MPRPKARCLALLLALCFAPRPAGAEPGIPPRLEHALQLLASVPEGASLAGFVRLSRVILRFGTCRVRLENAQAAACYDHRRRIITVSPGLEGAPLDVLAALIAHEATHAERSVGTQVGYLFLPAPGARAQLMLAEEAAAYRAQARIWRALRERRGTVEVLVSLFQDAPALAMELLARRVEALGTDAELVRFIATGMGYGAYYGETPAETSAGR